MGFVQLGHVGQLTNMTKLAMVRDPFEPRMIPTWLACLSLNKTFLRFLG